MTLVTVAAFPSIVDLSMAKTCLREHGIEYYIRDEHTAQTTEHRNVLVGGIKLDVKEEDALLATKILTEAGFIQPGEPATIPFWEKLSITQRFLLFFCAAVLFIGLLYLTQGSDR